MSRSDEVVYQQDDDWNMFPSYFIVCFFSLPSSSTAHSCDQLKYPFIFKSSPPYFKSYVSLHKSANLFSPFTFWLASLWQMIIERRRDNSNSLCSVCHCDELPVYYLNCCCHFFSSSWNTGLAKRRRVVSTIFGQFSWIPSNCCSNYECKRSIALRCSMLVLQKIPSVSLFLVCWPGRLFLLANFGRIHFSPSAVSTGTGRDTISSQVRGRWQTHGREFA